MGRPFSIRQPISYFTIGFAILLLWRAAVFLWINPLRAARSRSCTALNLSGALAADVFAFLRAVRSEDRWARLRTVAARDFLMFFLEEAIRGTTKLRNVK